MVSRKMKHFSFFQCIIFITKTRQELRIENYYHDSFLPMVMKRSIEYSQLKMNKMTSMME